MKQDHDHKKNNGISLAFWLNLLFSVIEFVGGMLTNSTAIIADAFHDFMDAVAIGFAVWLEKLSGKKRTENFSYGYKRFSLLAALGMSIFLLTGAGLMIAGAIKSFIHPEKVDSTGMLWLALLGVAVNGFAFLRIRQGSGHRHNHVHASGHSDHHNSKAIMLHLLEDVLGWVSVLAGAAVIYVTDWFWIDGVLAMGIALFIGYNAVRNLASTLKVMLQSVPDNVDIQKLREDLQLIDGIDEVHDLHIWSLDGNYNIGTVHAVINDTASKSKNDIWSSVVALMERHHIQHPTIQIEAPGNSCKWANC